MCFVFEAIVDFWNNGFDKTQKFLAVTHEECLKMEKDHECTDGELQGKRLLHTQNHLEVNFKWFSKGSDRKRNCFLQETELLVKPGHLDEIYSHLG